MFKFENEPFINERTPKSSFTIAKSDTAYKCIGSERISAVEFKNENR